MRRFKWIEWNIDKIEAHALSTADVERSFDNARHIVQRKDGSYQMMAVTPSGRTIWVVWRYDRETEMINPFDEAETFVITAY